MFSGHFRIIWPAEALKRQGHDVEIVRVQDRYVRLHIENDHVVRADIDADVVVFQRITHQWMAEAIPVLRRKGVAVVVDVDDDLTSVHPSNPAWRALHPDKGVRQRDNRFSWRHLNAACREATLVTVSTPALLPVYAPHGRGVVLPNYLPSAYDDLPHEDSDLIGWPASFHSHPNDPDALGGAVARIVADGARFKMIGDSTGAGAALGLPSDPSGGAVPIDQWPASVASLGVGIAPLADTRFNAAKSWLKPLEMCAAGVPWIASPRAEYERLHKRGAGVLAGRPRTWYREMKRLRESPALRAELSEAGRKVARGLRLDDHAWRWADAWERARDTQRGVQGPERVVA